MYKRFLLLLHASLMCQQGFAMDQLINEQVFDKYSRNIQEVLDNATYEDLEAHDEKLELSWVKKERKDSFIPCAMNDDHSTQIGSGSGEYTYIRNCENGNRQKPEKIHKDHSYNSSFSQDNQLCAIEDQEQVHIYKLGAFKKICSYKKGEAFDLNAPYSAFVGDKFFVYAHEKTVYAVDYSKIREGEETQPTQLMILNSQRTGGIGRVACINPSSVAFLMWSYTDSSKNKENQFPIKRELCVHNFTNDRHSFACLSSNDAVSQIVGDGDTRFVAVMEFKNWVELFENKTGHGFPKPKILHHKSTPRSAAFGPPGLNLLAVSTYVSDHVKDYLVYFWDLEKLQCIKRCDFNSFNIFASQLFWSLNGQSLQMVDNCAREWQADPEKLKLFLKIQELKKLNEKCEQEQVVNTN